MKTWQNVSRAPSKVQPHHIVKCLSQEFGWTIQQKGEACYHTQSEACWINLVQYNIELNIQTLYHIRSIVITM